MSKTDEEIEQFIDSADIGEPEGPDVIGPAPTTEEIDALIAAADELIAATEPEAGGTVEEGESSLAVPRFVNIEPAVEDVNDIRFIEDVRGKVTGRLVGNPNYRPETIETEDGTVYSIVRDWHPSPKQRENEEVFFINLERSVDADGVKLPVCGFAIGDEIFIKTGLSRLWAAQKYDRPCPALIVNVSADDRMGDYPRVDDLAEYFGEVEYDSHEAPGLGWFYTNLSTRVAMDDPRFMENMF